MEQTRIDTSNTGGRIAGIRVFLIDDSQVVRTIFSRLVESHEGLVLAGTASSAEDALAQLGSLHVQVILLDLEMPGMGGMKALPLILEKSGGAKVMVVSTLTKDGAQQTVEALAAGAADTLEKPAPGGFHEEYKAQLVEKIRQLGKRPLLRSAKDAAPRAAPVMRTLPAGFSPDVVAIGASTGGIQATAQLLAQLPHPLDVPIFITQHLPNEFTQPYARQIEAITGGKVMIAADGQCPGPGDVVLAPGDAHMLIEGNSARLRVRLAQGITDTGCMPSVDLMFASLAAINGLRTLGVVLTGMGRDGTEGARKLVDAGSCVMAQNEGSSVVWGMPGQVVKAGLACAQLHPADLAARIATLCVGKAA